MLSELAIGFCIIISAFLCRYYWLWFSFLRRTGFPLSAPLPRPFIGHTYNLKNPGLLISDVEMIRRFNGVAPVMDFWNPQLIIADPELLKQMMVRDFSSFTDRDTPGLLHKPLSANLLQIGGAQWKRVRSIVTPTFTSGKLKKVFPFIRSLADYCLNNFEEARANKQPVNVKKLFGFYTAGNIATMAFGLDIVTADARHRELLPKFLDDPFGYVGIDNLPMIASFLMPVLIPPKPNANGESMVTFVPEGLSRFVVEILDQVYAERTSGTVRDDFFQLLMNARAKVSGADGDNIEYAKLTKDELFSNAAIFLYAGYETTMTALSYAAMLLADRPDIQEECAKEAEAVMSADGSAELTYDHLANLPLTEAVLKEAMRLYTPVRRFFRLCTQPTHLGGMSLIPGDSIVIAAHALHRSPELWGPDADKFNPKRFFDRPQGDDPAFQAFGMGQRSCVGERLAMIEAKALLAGILLKYRLVPTSESVIPPQVYSWTWVTKSPHELILGVEARDSKSRS